MTRLYALNFQCPWLLLCGITCCVPVIKNEDYLVAFNDTIKNEYGYKNQFGKIVIPLGKYQYCFTDTSRTFALVAKSEIGLFAIDRQENILYKVFLFDNGPDNGPDEFFRIIKNNKIGYADANTGEVIIIPQFDCAFPFENGVAKVSLDCKTQLSGEHNVWVSDNWF
jgi:hypothetical protein